MYPSRVVANQRYPPHKNAMPPVQLSVDIAGELFYTRANQWGVIWCSFIVSLSSINKNESVLYCKHEWQRRLFLVLLTISSVTRRFIARYKTDSCVWHAPPNKVLYSWYCASIVLREHQQLKSLYLSNKHKFCFTTFPSNVGDINLWCLADVFFRYQMFYAALEVENQCAFPFILKRI